MGKSRSQSGGSGLYDIVRLLKTLHRTVKPLINSRAGRKVLKTVATRAIKSDKIPNIVKKTGQILVNTTQPAKKSAPKRKFVSTKKKKQVGGGNNSKIIKKTCNSSRKHTKKPKLRDLFSE